MLTSQTKHKKVSKHELTNKNRTIKNLSVTTKINYSMNAQ